MNRRLVIRSLATLTLLFAGGGTVATAAEHRRIPATLPEPAAKGTELYYGGPVIAHVQVVNVNWGSGVASQIATGSEGMYKALLQSSYLDAMGEYDTVGVTAQGGAKSTQQRIYRGTFVKTVTIQPKVTSGTVTFAQIETEIDAQVTAGTLPAPVKDPDGTVDTIYAIAFPSNVTISDGSANSCSSFGALHDTISVSGLQTPFSATADCGSGSFTEFTVSASHELAEAVTDATPSATTPVVGVQAWNDTQGNEVADVCESGSGSSAKFGTYTVATYWSNRLAKCIAGDPNLTLCDGTTRPCRPCGAQDCAAPQTCDTDPASKTQGQCIATTSDAGASSSGSGSGGSSGSGSGSSGSGSSSGSSGSGSGSSSSGSGSGSGGSSGGSSGGASSGSGSGGGSGGSSGAGSSSGSSGHADSGSGGGPTGDAGGDRDGGTGNQDTSSSSGGCGCTNAPPRAGDAGSAGVLGLVVVAGLRVLGRRRPTRRDRKD
jgi:hypothetical protein